MKLGRTQQDIPSLRSCLGHRPRVPVIAPWASRASAPLIQSAQQTILVIKKLSLPTLQME